METTFKNKLIQKLNTKNLTDSTIDFYIKNLERLNDNKPLKNFKFLEDFDTIINKLNDKKETTKRSYLISIVSALGSMVNKKNSSLLSKYQDEMYSEHEKIKKSNDGKKTETQKENWIPWDDILKEHQKLKSEVETFSKKKNISEEQYKILLDYLVLSLYVCELPPRRNKDYLEMYITNNVGNATDTKKNYYVISSNEMIFNNYKTSKTEKQLIVPIGKCLKSALDIYLKHHPIYKNNKSQSFIPLLVDFEGNHLNKINSITRILNKIFQGKKIGSSMLRHIRDTNKYGEVMKEMKEDSKLMGHTLETKINDYIKQ
jgi:integrase